MTNYYDDLEARLTDPSRPLESTGDAETGPEAAAAGRAFLIGAYGSMEAVDRAMVKPGRPRVGERHGASPTVRGRLADTEYEAFQELERRTGASQSELVRRAVHQLLVENKLVG